MKMQYRAMHKGLLMPLISLLGVLCLGACSETEAPPAATPAPAPAAATAPAPVIVKPAVESDAVALSEEELDKVKAEQDELAAREADLKAQIEDGEMIIEMKEKQIRELEAKLKKSGSTKS